MFSTKVNTRTDLRLIGRQHTGALFGLVDSNREHLRGWHPWVDNIRSIDDIGKMIAMWEQQNAKNRGFCAAIMFDEQLCGLIHHLNVDWPNRWTALSYWLDAAHQGQGIMTSCCRALILHGFNNWKLNRITIECATENLRSRAIPERLGFKLEGIIRSVEWLHDRYADHAIYGLLRPECIFAAEPS
jgi:ribosomal-protein-serine acetyltransferase